MLKNDVRKKICCDRESNRSLLDLESNVLSTRPSAHITVIQVFRVFNFKLKILSVK